MLGFGYGFGVFLNASDPNRAMRDWARSVPGAVGVANDEGEFLLMQVPTLSIDVGLTPWLRLQSSSEFAIGGADVTVLNAEGDIVATRGFAFGRFSEIVVANLEYPVNEAKTTNIFVGAGPGIHYMKFTEHDVTTVGFRAQLGMGLLQKAVRADGVIGFDYVRAVAEKEHEWSNGQVGRFVLDFTSLHLSAIIHFNVVP